MNKEWSELNKELQSRLKKEGTFKEGLKFLFRLRDELADELLSYKKELKREDFNAMPFMNADGYHSKTIAYSIWHIFRIEDIVAHSLIKEDDQIFFSGRYKERIGSPIITTGNELEKEQIADFSEKLNIDELYSYMLNVKNSTECILKGLSFDMLKKRIPCETKDHLMALNVVSTSENAAWLIDYWCGKDIRGLIQMPFSRHWIMHVEACMRIKSKLKK